MLRTLIAAAIAVRFATATAQEPPSLPCDRPARTDVPPGKSIRNGCPEPQVIRNDLEEKKLRAEQKRTAELLAELQQYRQKSGEVIEQQAQLTNELKGLVDAEKQYYDQLKALQQQTDALVVRATTNTEAALAEAKRSRYAGWASGALVGAVGGGVAGLQLKKGDGATATFALTGALFGFGIAWLINH